MPRKPVNMFLETLHRTFGDPSNQAVFRRHDCRWRNTIIGSSTLIPLLRGTWDKLISRCRVAVVFVPVCPFLSSQCDSLKSSIRVLTVAGHDPFGTTSHKISTVILVFYDGL